MTGTGSEEHKKGSFAPKQPVELAPPKDDPITPEYLEKCDGKSLGS
jgi:membrane-associated progesterone receptor component